MRKAGDVADKTVCDIGCGSGRFVSALAQRGAHVTGLDFAPTMLKLAGDLVERTVGPCKQALKDASLKPDQIDEVVLVGGSTRVPLVRRRVEELFGQVPQSKLNPDEVVALGAAVQADIMTGRRKDMQWDTGEQGFVIRRPPVVRDSPFGPDGGEGS